MGKMAKIVADIEGWVEDDVRAAVAAGEGASANDLSARIITEWALARRTGTPEFMAEIRAAIEESRNDPHPGYPLEEVFAELDAELAQMIDEHDGR